MRARSLTQVSWPVGEDLVPVGFVGIVRTVHWRHMHEYRFNVFGRIVLVRREADLWQAYSVGAEGKRSPAGFVIPEFIEETELEQYLFDLFHEKATPGNGDVRRLP